MDVRKTSACLLVVVLLVFTLLVPGFPAAGNNNSSGNNDDGNDGDDSGAQDLIEVLVLFTGPQNWDYAGVIGVEDAEGVSLELTSTEDIF